MPSLTLKNIPPELLEKLRTAATRDRRSLMQQALHLIEGGLAEQESVDEEIRRQLDAWSHLGGGYRSGQTFEEEVADIYAARTPGRDVEL